MEPLKATILSLSLLHELLLLKLYLNSAIGNVHKDRLRKLESLENFVSQLQSLGSKNLYIPPQILNGAGILPQQVKDCACILTQGVQDSAWIITQGLWDSAGILAQGVYEGAGISAQGVYEGAGISTQGV